MKVYFLIVTSSIPIRVCSDSGRDLWEHMKYGGTHGSGTQNENETNKIYKKVNQTFQLGINSILAI